MTTPIRVLFATAEFAPLARVGGLAEAAAGLVAELRRAPDRYAVDVDVVLPDYGDVVLSGETITTLEVPPWAGSEARVRRGVHAEIGAVTLVATTGTERPHPYTDESGNGWADNDVRFFGFAAAIGALAAAERPDVLHLNDWHAAAAVGFIPDGLPTVLTIHTLGYQGITGPEWLDRVPRDRGAFEWFDVTNPLVAGIRRADRIIAVSPNYAAEIMTPEFGAGHHLELAQRRDALIGIRNGIDTAQWNPAADPLITANYEVGNAARRKAENQRALLAKFGLPVPHDSVDSEIPVVGVVSRLVEQKGIDLLLQTVPFFANLGARLVILGSGDAGIAAQVAEAASAMPDVIAFYDGYDAQLAHDIFAGSDLFVMPSRFEPCGLAQMQAMTYGSIPIVTAVGGLVDTVTDAYDHPETGTGIVAKTVSSAALTDALHRGVQLWRKKAARAVVRKNGMVIDWSWKQPAAEHVAVYRSLLMPNSGPPRDPEL